ncbi:hypothetical protein AB0L53_57175 [Nonomuraea sp. NPDC052129]|uniref:hypothetical protein n=1 Tax=Nonomuraea sp. NPDC052129 TaxID=3154651 RepID=UPI0034451C8B
MTHALGLLDTDILILRAGLDPDELPDEMMISAITTAELSAGVLAATGPQELAQRMKILQTTEARIRPTPLRRHRSPRVRPVVDGGHRLRAQTTPPHCGPDDRLRGDREPASSVHLQYQGFQRT